jgi:SpoVK/Ycf46/Vps4 family AAA+-type ATPase
MFTELGDKLKSGFCAFWIKSNEYSRCYANTIKFIKDYKRKDGTGYNYLIWDLTKGSNPNEPIQKLISAEKQTILVVSNFHWFIDKPPVIQQIQNNMESWKTEAKAIIVLSCVENIPKELSRDFVVMSMPLPTEKEIDDSIEYIAKAGKITVDNKDEIKESAKGLTQTEIENIMALSIVKHGKIDKEVINSQRAQVIEKSGILEFVKPTVTFDDVCGYDNIKRFVLATHNHPEAKGVMLLGPPGAGKTMFMNALAGETGRLTLAINFGKLFSRYQGDTDKNVEDMISIIESIGNCIVQLDEMEKALSGATGDGTLDSGVTRRATGRFLRFMSEKSPGIYLITTCNSFRGLPPEFLRCGRFDSSPWFIDLPNEGEKELILDYYVKKYGIEVKIKPKMDQWTGAEIESCARIAKMTGFPFEDAAQFIVPQAIAMKDEIDIVRDWAKANAIKANSQEALEKVRKLRIVEGK